MTFSHPIEVRFRDVDALGHVNHAVVVSYLEVARYAWWRDFLKGRSFQAEGFLIARVEADYRVPIQLGDEVAVELRCSRVGRSSFDLDYRVLRGSGLLLAEGRALADVVRELGHVAEGVPAAREVARRAEALGVDMPITRAVTAVLDGRISPRAAVEQLMSRGARHE